MIEAVEEQRIKTKTYALGEDGKTPYPIASWYEWAEKTEGMDRTVGYFLKKPMKPLGKPPAGKAKRNGVFHRLNALRAEEVEVSTVFLSIDHAFMKDSEPVLFETLVRGGRFDFYMVRYHTWDESEKGHELMVRRVTGNSSLAKSL